MGAKKHRRSLSGEAVIAGGKQLRMDLYLKNDNMGAVTRPFPVSNRFSVLNLEQENGEEHGRETESEERQLTAPEHAVIAGKTPKSLRKIVNRGKSASDLELLAEQTALISETIVNLYVKLDQINISLEKVKSSLSILTNKALSFPPEEPGVRAGNNLIMPNKDTRTTKGVATTGKHHTILLSEPTGKNYRRLTPKKIALLIGKLRINIGRWACRKEVEHSLCQILGKTKAGLGITNILWLPDKNFHKRIVISFASNSLPSLILRKRSKLRDFLIFPTRVFEDSLCLPLCKLRELQK